VSYLYSINEKITKPNKVVCLHIYRGIDWRILYHPLPRHLKYFPSPFPFPASGRILPPSLSPWIPTVLADIHQLLKKIKFLLFSIDLVVKKYSNLIIKQIKVLKYYCELCDIYKHHI
jgi:hypothetical protein